MNYPSLVFLGVFFSFALSWAGMVLLPQLQIGREEPVVIQETNQPYPSHPSGMAQQGKEVYRQLGCAACHTQQVRPFDVPRGRVRRPLYGSLDEIREDVRRYAELGLTELFLEANMELHGWPVEQMLDLMAALAPAHSLPRG